MVVVVGDLLDPWVLPLLFSFEFGVSLLQAIVLLHFILCVDHRIVCILGRSDRSTRFLRPQSLFASSI